MQNLTQKGHKLQNMGKKNAKPSHNSYPFSIRMLSGQNQDTKKRWTVDTGQNFQKGSSKAQFLKANSKVKNPKAGTFLRAPEDLEGLRSQKNLIFQNAQKQVQTINSNILL